MQSLMILSLSVSSVYSLYALELALSLVQLINPCCGPKCVLLLFSDVCELTEEHTFPCRHMQ